MSRRRHPYWPWWSELAHRHVCLTCGRRKRSWLHWGREPKRKVIELIGQILAAVKEG